jgi:hypothetical protein
VTKDVHTEHCCQIHGCKYRYDIGNMSKWCLDDEELREAYEANEMFDKGVAFAIQQAHDLDAIIFGG